MRRVILLLAAVLTVAVWAKGQTVHFAGREVANLFSSSNTFQSAVNYCADAGSTDDYACSLSPAITAYSTGAVYSFSPNTANTGTATLNLNSLGAKTIKRWLSGTLSDLQTGDIAAGQQVVVIYDGTYMVLASMNGNTTAPTWDATTGFRVNGAAASGKVLIGDGTNFTPGDPMVQGLLAHDAPDTSNPVLMGGYAKASAPTDVSADGDAVNTWHLRNGSPVVNLATGGTLYDARQIRALTSSDIVKAQLQDNGGNGLTSNSTTYAAKFALDMNLLGTLGTAFSTAGKVDIKGADGDVTVRCSSGANCPVNATLAAETTKVIGTVRSLGNAGAVFDQATGSAVPANILYVGGNGSGNATGLIVCDNSSVINMSTATTTQIIAISGTGGRTYICSINLVTAAANNVALISGSGTNCASNQAGLAGGTTAASGWNFAANGGLTMGSGLGMVIKTTTTNNEVCLVTSASTQLSGSISWTQF